MLAIEIQGGATVAWLASGGVCCIGPEWYERWKAAYDVWAIA